MEKKSRYQKTIENIENLYKNGEISFDGEDLFYRGQRITIPMLRMHLEYRGINVAGGKGFLNDILNWLRNKDSYDLLNISSNSRK